MFLGGRPLNRWFAFSLLLLGLLAVPHAAHAQSSPSSSKPDTTTFRSNTRVVLLDISVKDEHGLPVKNLQASDFQIFDNKKPQKAASFELHTSSTNEYALGKPTDENGVFSNNSFAHPPPVINALLIDTNTIGLADQMYLYDQLVRFIQTLPPNEPIALYRRWGESTILLQNYTADHQLLLTALRQAIPHPQIQGSETYSDIDTLRQMVEYFADVPGRKNVLWFTGGSNRLNLANPRSMDEPMSNQIGFEHDLHTTFNRLEVERIALYPIDVRGLFRSGVKMGRNNALFDQQNLMTESADSTGGAATYNNNGITAATENIISHDGDFYTLSYAPDDLKFDGKWHRISIKLSNPKYHLSYRQGYFDDSPPDKSERASGKRETDSSNSKAESVHRAPIKPIIFQVKALPANQMPPAMVGDSPNPPKDAPKRGQTTYTVEYKVPIEDFRKDTHNGTSTIHVGAAVIAFSRSGRIGASLSQTLTLSFDDTQAQGPSSGLISFAQSINLPESQKYLSLAVWDTVGGRVGTLQLPLDTKKAKN